MWPRVKCRGRRFRLRASGSSEDKRPMPGPAERGRPGKVWVRTERSGGRGGGGPGERVVGLGSSGH